MRGQALLALGALTAGLSLAQPAFADHDPYRYGASASPAYTRAEQECRDERTRRTVGGAVIGAIAGAVFGNNVASGGHQGDGTTLGAVLGGAAGAAIGRSSADCDRLRDQHVYRGNDGYGRDPYDDGSYGDGSGLYGGPPRDGYRRAGYSGERCEWQEVRIRDRHGRYHNEDVYMCLDHDGVWRAR
jgi:hypothetical protein